MKYFQVNAKVFQQEVLNTKWYILDMDGWTDGYAKDQKPSSNAWTLTDLSQGLAKFSLIT